MQRYLLGVVTELEHSGHAGDRFLGMLPDLCRSRRKRPVLPVKGSP